MGPGRTALAREGQRARPPSVEGVLSLVRDELREHDPAALAAVAREVIAAERGRLSTGETPSEPARLAALLVERIRGLGDGRSDGLVRVINATGVILHTNLGRASWPRQAIEAAGRAAGDYVLLELDRADGRRGRRSRAAEDHLVALTGAEDALVVNNNAAAVALAVGLAGRRGVAVGRGELVEIGGGVRIPEIVRRAGARLVEVGTTNRTRLADFAEALASGRVAVVLRVHPSNFRQSGFVESPDPRALAALAHEHGALVVDDLGSGALIDTAPFGLAHEPTPAERLADGSDVVAFSGDKLVGGPQAGLVVGRRELVARMRRDPLARAMRPDKVTLAGVAATLALYRAGVAAHEIPVWRTIGLPADGIRARAEDLAGHLRETAPGAPIRVAPVESTVGGGSLPGESLPSWAVALRVRSPDGLAASLRAGVPCVIARIEKGEVVLDLRTVDPGQDRELASALEPALAADAS